MNKLKQSILEVIANDNFDLNTLKRLLTPLHDFIDNPIFVDNLKQIIEIITTDRDGNNKFTIKDVELLKDDYLSITSLISAILAVLNSVPGIKLKYDAGATEELIFKLLVYIFLVVIPKQTNNKWTYDEKVHIIDITLNIYQIIVSSQTTKDLVAKITQWFKSKGLCKCLSGQQTKEDVLQKKMPLLKAELATNVKNNKDKIMMQEQINDLKREIQLLKN